MTKITKQLLRKITGSLIKLTLRSSYYRYLPGTSWQLSLMQGVFSHANDIFLFLMIFPPMSLRFNLVPVK